MLAFTGLRELLSREQAYIICSVAVDLRVSNVVDVPNYVVSALLPEDIFQG
jgi:formamidase